MSNENINSPITVIFRYEQNDREDVIALAKPGENILTLARRYDIDIEGSCGGVCACATCHVWIDDKWFDKLSPMLENEACQLDQASQIKPRSRLCCQIKVQSSEDIDSPMIVTVPATSNAINDHHH